MSHLVLKEVRDRGGWEVREGGRRRERVEGDRN